MKKSDAILELEKLCNLDNLTATKILEACLEIGMLPPVSGVELDGTFVIDSIWEPEIVLPKGK